MMFLSILTFLSIISCRLVSTRPNTQPNIVFILTDDQDVFLLGPNPMPKAKALIGDAGMTFSNMFVSSPLCCPSRASILTGKYIHNHHTVNNSVSGNCSSPLWQKTAEPTAFPVYLKKKGYQTFFAGKYLNQYGRMAAGGVSHIPPGWDEWNALVGNSVYYNYSLSVNGVEEKHGDNYETDYLTDLIRKRAISFLSKKKSGKPFFLMLSTPACHQPFDSAPQYMKNFTDKKAPRTKSFNTHGKNKHWLVEQAITPLPNDTIAMENDFFRKRWRTLLSVDDMIEDVVSQLKRMNILDDTYIFFTSDNGYHLGQFSLPYDKRQPYEFDVRVPLMVRGPGIKPKSVSEENIMTIDLAPSFVEIASDANQGIFDGTSFLSILKGETHQFRATVLVEYQGEKSPKIPHCPQFKGQGLFSCNNHCVCEDSWNNTYACIRHKTSDATTYKYCVFQDNANFVELYDLKNDPDEMTNIVSTASSSLLTLLSKELANMSLCAGQSCHTKPGQETKPIPKRILSQGKSNPYLMNHTNVSLH